jgi:hypothetical protein
LRHSSIISGEEDIHAAYGKAETTEPPSHAAGVCGLKLFVNCCLVTVAVAVLKLFERSKAVEPFDRTQGRLLEHLERTDPRDERSACPERREASRRKAVEPFDRTQGRRLERLELAAV